MIDLSKNNIERKTEQIEYIDVYFNKEIEKQLYEIGYIKPYYFNYVVPKIYKYQDKDYRIIDSVWINEQTRQRCERRKFALLGQILFLLTKILLTIMLLALIFLFLVISDIDIFNRILMSMSLFIVLLVIWIASDNYLGVTPDPYWRLMKKEDYDN